SLLSNARLAGYDGVPPNRLAGILMFNIREEQLKRAIKEATFELRRVEGELARQAGQGSGGAGSPLPAKRDELFRHVGELQLELNELRRKHNLDGLL
ncbi:MAG TPA: hypothetical protein DEB24_03595, partial [Coriobacteriia bacterium]|nr:hypothetical protein [Coriobacteriia bacterium]